jgi:hypothetical protein
MTSMPPQWVREVKLEDLDGRGHAARALRDSRGVIYLEVTVKHDGVQVFSTFRLGDAADVFRKLIPLK